MELHTKVEDLFRLAADESAALVDLLGKGSEIDPSRSAPLFRRLRGRLLALPISQVTFALLTNMVADAESLIARSEAGAARWQLTQAGRRLLRLLAEWESDTGPSIRRTYRTAGSDARPRIGV